LGVESYLLVLTKWQAAAAASEALVARAAGGGDGGGAGARKVAALLLSVGFEAGMWDLLSVLATARLACKAVLDMIGPEQALPAA
jgi:hypothetical protein